MEHHGILRVFISSTFVDLQIYRQSVFNAILSCGFTGEDMIYWTADEREPTSVSVERVRQSDVVILLIAHRYGFIPEGTVHSITEQEYIAARQLDIPVLAFLVDEAVPWPPQYIEWEKRDQLAALKKRVQKELTIRTFKTPDNLAALVSQSLATLTVRRSSMQPAIIHRRKSIRGDSAANLRHHPDLFIRIGDAEDGLPLVAKIRRSRDLQPFFSELARSIFPEGQMFPSALISTLRQAVEQEALAAWTSDGIVNVRMSDGSTEELFVWKRPLGSIFRSSFELLTTRSQRPPTKVSEAGVRPRTTAAMSSQTGQLRPWLQSEGGCNRFLGISVAKGTTFSVGRPLGEYGERLDSWLEWRPFVFESLPRHFPEATFIVGSSNPKRSKLSGYEGLLMDAISADTEGEELFIPVSVEVTCVALAKLIADIARSVGQLHARGQIHGDLKPSNVLLAGQGVVLIDDFQLKPGELAPGWTPGWSAPEQSRGEPVSFSSDVYPFGRLLVELLHGELVGEVRKFKVSFDGKAVTEFDIFYNPSVRTPNENPIIATPGLKAWTDLARNCLRFDPESRVDLNHFEGELRSLIERWPPQGIATVSLDNQLALVSFMDMPQLARIISFDVNQEQVISIFDPSV